jgi:hypothetical protein
MTVGGRQGFSPDRHFQEVYLFFSWERHLAAMLSWLDPGFRQGRRHSHKEQNFLPQ